MKNLFRLIQDATGYFLYKTAACVTETYIMHYATF